MKTIVVLEFPRARGPHALSDTFIWLKLIRHEHPSKNRPSIGKGAGNIAARIGDVHGSDMIAKRSRLTTVRIGPENNISPMFASKPIIGIVGGIGSGKSLVARIFGELGCLVIDSDQQVSQAYHDPKILRQIRSWWGDSVFRPDGQVDRKAIGRIVFSDPVQRKRLEGLLHPWVATARNLVMKAAASRAQVLAYVWDTPLLIETGLDAQCDAIVFVDAPPETRLARVKVARCWDKAELARREKLQIPLDKKRKISDYVIDNTADEDAVRGQASKVLPRILVTDDRKV
jgi:dephospho-CoA kinase